MTLADGRPRVSLTGYLFMANVVLLACALVVTALLWSAHHSREVERHYEQRALAIARAVAAKTQESSPQAL
jgi:two-component system, CitB family, sensor kinase